MAHSLTPAALWDWWRNPDEDNQPAGYIDAPERTAFLLALFRKYVKKDWGVLELGCNVGRNLNALSEAGYRHLSGIEVNPDAALLMIATYENLRRTSVWVEPIEDAIRKVPETDVIFTMAVLEHLHTESEWVFAEMVRKASRAIVTIEDEVGTSERHFPRDYGSIFRTLGMREVQSSRCTAIKGLGPDFVARVFVK